MPEKSYIQKTVSAVAITKILTFFYIQKPSGKKILLAVYQSTLFLYIFYKLLLPILFICHGDTITTRTATRSWAETLTRIGTGIRIRTRTRTGTRTRLRTGTRRRSQTGTPTGTPTGTRIWKTWNIDTERVIDREMDRDANTDRDADWDTDRDIDRETDRDRSGTHTR